MSVSLLRLHELYESLTPSERRIADYFEANLDKLVDTSILEVAEACQTSKSAVVRLCKKSGYRGYKDFLNAVSADLAVRSSRLDEPTDILPGSSISEICHIVTANSIRSLENTLSVLDMDALSRAVDVISRANRIDFYGVGSSGIIAQDAAFKFRRIGLNTFSSLDSHYQIISASTLAPGDVALVFSYYGETRDIIDSLNAAHESGATIISITKFGKNAIAGASDIALHVASAETLTRSGAMSSRMVMLQIVDMLFTAVASQNYDRVRETLNRTAEAVKSKRL